MGKMNLSNQLLQELANDRNILVLQPYWDIYRQALPKYKTREKIVQTNNTALRMQY